MKKEDIESLKDDIESLKDGFLQHAKYLDAMFKNLKSDDYGKANCIEDFKVIKTSYIKIVSNYSDLITTILIKEDNLNGN